MPNTLFAARLNTIGAFLLLLAGFLLQFLWASQGRQNGVCLYDPTFMFGVGMFGVLLAVAAVYLLLTRSGKVSNGRLLLCSLVFFWLLFEGAAQIGLKLGLVGPHALPDCEMAMLNRPFAKVDYGTGFRWLPNDSCRIVKVSGGEVVYDQWFGSNNRGYISDTDFAFEKPDSLVKRYMVLGDSFTSGHFLPRNWVDYANELLKQAGEPAELYAFGVDGGGLVNWYYVFENEMLPHYDFDGLIIAHYGDGTSGNGDFDRGLAIMDMDTTAGRFNWFAGLPKNKPDFERNYLPKMYKIGDVLDNAGINRRLDGVLGLKAGKGGGLRLFTIDMIYGVAGRVVGKLASGSAGRAQLAEIGSMADFGEKYGERKWKMLNDMMTWCRQNGKEVIWCNVPEEYGVVENLNGKRTVAQKELKVISKQYDAALFDGYAIFEKVREDDVRQYFLKNDGHWSTKGSDLFAERFVEWILNDTKLH